MRKYGYTGGELVVVLGGFILMSASVGRGMFANSPGNPFAAQRDESKQMVCESNLRQISLGIIAYVQDYDERYPLTRGSGVPHDASYGWAGSVQSYLKSIQILHCPLSTGETANDTSSADFTDYWYNGRLSNCLQEKLKNPANTLLLGDGNDNHDLTDARYSKSQLAPDWYTDTGKPTFRHLNEGVKGANYAFADGHVKWLKPAEVTTSPISAKVFTFATG